MSRFLDANADRVTTGTSAMPTTGSVHFWLWPNWAQTDGIDHIFFSATSSSTNDFSLQKFSDNKLYCGWHGATDSRIVVSSYTLNGRQWNSFLITWDSSSAILYLDGLQIGSFASPTIFTTSGPRCWGNWNSSFGAINLNGYLAECAIWTAKLSVNEAASLASGVLPFRVRPASLVEYLPMWGLSSPEPNLVAGGTAGTVSGTTSAVHAPVTTFTKKQSPPLFGGVAILQQQMLTLLGCGA